MRTEEELSCTLSNDKSSMVGCRFYSTFGYALLSSLIDFLAKVFEPFCLSVFTICSGFRAKSFSKSYSSSSFYITIATADYDIYLFSFLGSIFSLKTFYTSPKTYLASLLCTFLIFCGGRGEDDLILSRPLLT